LIPAIIAIVLILLLGSVGGIMLAGRGSSSGVASKSPSPQTSPKTSPKASPAASPRPSPAQVPLAVPNYGPASADRIQKVQICTPENVCTYQGGSDSDSVCNLNSCVVDVAVYFTTPGRQLYTGPLTYSFKFFDRCASANATKDIPGPPTRQINQQAVWIPFPAYKLALPTGVKSAALVAVTQDPAVAASDPVYLGSKDSCA
jgi:hypothetical protein